MTNSLFCYLFHRFIFYTSILATQTAPLLVLADAGARYLMTLGKNFCVYKENWKDDMDPDVSVIENNTLSFNGLMTYLSHFIACLVPSCSFKFPPFNRKF